MAFQAYQGTVSHGTETETVTETQKQTLVYPLSDVIVNLLDSGEEITVVYRKITAEEVPNAQQQP